MRSKVYRQKAVRIGGCISVFLVSLSICIAVTGVYIHNKSNMEYAQMEQLVLTKSNKVNNVITKLLYKTEALSALVIQSDGKIEDFERVAATILDDPAIKNVILAPKGIVTNVYPLEENEEVIGLDYFSKGAGNLEAIQAKETGELVLGGPFDLIQGEQALVGRFPVFIGDKRKEENFWGLVSVTLKYPNALKGAELHQLIEQGFAFEIWRKNPDDKSRQVIACSEYEYNKNTRYVEKDLNILNAKWHFRLSPVRQWYQYTETWLFTFAGIAISLLISYLVLNNHDLKRVKENLEALTYADCLTGILNRRGLFRDLEELIQDPLVDKFILYYIDLDNFKTINDKFGHNMGDSVLQKFVSIFVLNIDERHIFARIGGDEFILIFKDADEEKADNFFEEIYNDLSQFVYTKDVDRVNVNFSIGKGVYPQNGKSIDQLIAYADSEMYHHKANFK